MNNSINRKLKDSKLLINQENYKKALEFVETIFSNEFLSIGDMIEWLLLNCRFKAILEGTI